MSARALARAAAVVGTAVVLVAGLSACGRVSDEELQGIEDTVRASSADVADATVDDGLDGTSRYLFVLLEMQTDEIPPDALADVADALGASVPDVYDTVRLHARGASGERLLLEEPLDAAGVDGVFMLNERSASIAVPALPGGGTD